MVTRRIRADVAEIQVKRHECPVFTGADLNNVLIGGADQTLVKDRLGVMSGRDQKVGDCRGKVFVDFEIHAATFSGIGNIRSFANSAAYETAA